VQSGDTNKNPFHRRGRSLTSTLPVIATTAMREIDLVMVRRTVEGDGEKLEAVSKGRTKGKWKVVAAS